jgi:hypothetical protein
MHNRNTTLDLSSTCRLARWGGRRPGSGRKPKSPLNYTHQLRVSQEVHGLLKAKTKRYRRSAHRRPNISMTSMVSLFLKQQESFPEAIAGTSPKLGEPSKWIRISHTDYLEIEELGRRLGLSKAFVVSSLIILGDEKND